MLVRRQAKKSNAAAVTEPAARGDVAPAERSGATDYGAAVEAPAARPSTARAERVVPADKRWHLGSGQSRVTDAWAVPGLAGDRARGARDIKIAILDDGCDVAHADFAGRIVAQYDFEEGVADARPKGPKDNHGTACVGVAAAAGVGPASGAAPGCSIIAARTPNLLGVDEEARMFQWATDQGADVISCSWGPADGTGNLDPLPDNVAAAIRYCVTKGRGGRGIPILWAAGNGDESVSLDGYASCPDVIAVAASTSKNGRAWYSDFGPEIWVCAPSSGDDDAGELSIFTTDRSGADGYNSGDTSLGDATGNYTGDFGGTSSAAPLTAGIVGLVLSANPDLYENPTSPKGREVREVLAATAAKIGSGYTNGHSPQFGFGRVDAAAAVREALRRKSGGNGGDIDSIPEAVVDGPTRWRHDAGPPSLRVDPGPGRFYAVEFAVDSSLFDAATRGAGPLPVDRFYASWDESALFQALAYPANWTMPESAWDALRAAPRLYYRIWGSDAASAWTRAVASTKDSDYALAPSMELVDFEEDRNGSAPTVTTITGPASVARSGELPSFVVSTGAGRFFAVEVATDRSLLDTSAASRRGLDAYFASWDAGRLIPANTRGANWSLPAAAWERLRTASALYYRVWSSAQQDRWVDIQSSQTDEEAVLRAPSVQIGDGTTSTRRTVGTAGGSDATLLRYPSGAELPVQDPKKVPCGSNFAPPAGVPDPAPLVSVAYRLDRPLSGNFRVRDFASRTVAEDGAGYAHYARIAPALVDAVSRVAGISDVPVDVVLGYVHPAMAEDDARLGGADRGLNWHVAGLAADIRPRSGRPLDLARNVLHALGSGIGIGLLRDGVHIDLRRDPAAWAEAGAEVNGDAFAKWVEQVMAEDQRVGQARRERSAEPVDGTAQARAEMPLASEAFSVTGPDVYASGADEPPVFYVEFAADTACRVEVAGSEDRLGSEDKQFVWSEELRPPSLKQGRVWRMPKEAWAALREGRNLYYRAVTARSAADARTQVGVVALTVGNSPRSKSRLERQLPDAGRAAARDEARWRGSSTDR